MHIHHLNCGTIRPPGGVALIGTGGPFTRAPGVTHCVLAETDDGLLLVDTGFGMLDCLTPKFFVWLMISVAGWPRNPEETAVTSKPLFSRNKRRAPHRPDPLPLRPRRRAAGFPPRQGAHLSNRV